MGESAEKCREPVGGAVVNGHIVAASSESDSRGSSLGRRSPSLSSIVHDLEFQPVYLQARLGKELGKEVPNLLSFFQGTFV